MSDALLCAARRRDKGAAEYFRTILDFVGVSALLIEEVYFRPSAHAKREAALTKLGTAIDQHIVVPPGRRAAGMNSLQSANRRTVPNAGNGRYPIGDRRLILSCQSAGRGDFGIGIEVGPFPQDVRFGLQWAGDT